MEWVAARIGSIGTNLLLLLSGYFMAQNLASGRFTYGRFVALRLIRIYVPYLVMLLLAVGFSSLRPRYARAEVAAATVQTLLQQLLLFPGLFPERPVLTVTWTLSYIVAGYLLFPIVGEWLRRAGTERDGRLAVWSGVTVGVFAVALSTEVPSIRFAYVPAGCLVFEVQAAAWGRGRVWIPQTLLTLTGMLLVVRILLDGQLLGAEWPRTLARGLYSASGLGLVSGLVGLALIVERRYRLSEQSRMVRYAAGFGRTGYSFYLVHGPVVKLIAMLAFPPMAAAGAPAVAYWGALPLCWAVAAGGALVLYRTVERPSRKILMPRLSELADAR